MAARRFWLEVSGAYFLTAVATDPGLRHGGQFALAVHLHPQWSLVLDFRGCQPTTVTQGDVSFSLQHWPVGLGARWRWQWPVLELGAAVSVILDYARHQTEAGDPSLEFGADRGDILWWIAPMAHLAVRFGRRYRVFVQAGVQIGLNLKRYVRETGSQTATVFSPWPVQPAMMLGLSVDVF